MSLQHTLLGKQPGQARLVHDRPVEDFLESLPLPIVEPEHPPIRQSVLGGLDSSLKEKLRDALVQ